MSTEKPVGRRSTVFISYAHEDVEQARLISQALSDAGFQVWFDEWSLEPGKALEERIQNAMRSVDKLVLILSPRAASSRWVRSELDQASSVGLEKRGIDIIPAVIEPCEIPSHLEDWGPLDLSEGNPRGPQQLIERLEHSTAIDLKALSSVSFGSLVADLLERLGYEIKQGVRIGRGERAKLVDFTATYSWVDPLGVRGEVVWLVESKYYSHNRVSIDSIRQLSEYLRVAPDDVHGLLVTNGLLTSVVRDYLEKDDLAKDRLKVLDGIRLRQLLVQNPDLAVRYFGGGDLTVRPRSN